MRLQNQKCAVLVENIFNDYEFIYPYYRLLEEGAYVEVVGPEKGKKYTGKYGTPATSTISPGEIDVDRFSALLIPGGYAPDHMRRSKEMIELVRAFSEKSKVIGAICHAGWMLASANVLKGKTVTSFFAIRDDMKNAGANWVDQEVCVDGELITSRTPDDLPTFMRKIIETSTQ